MGGRRRWRRRWRGRERAGSAREKQVEDGGGGSISQPLISHCSLFWSMPCHTTAKESSAGAQGARWWVGRPPAVPCQSALSHQHPDKQTKSKKAEKTWMIHPPFCSLSLPLSLSPCVKAVPPSPPLSLSLTRPHLLSSSPATWGSGWGDKAADGLLATSQPAAPAPTPAAAPAAPTALAARARGRHLRTTYHSSCRWV